MMDEKKQEHDVMIREYEPQETIVTEGAAPDMFYVILNGMVEIRQNRKNIRLLKEDDVFGLENFYLARPYTTTAVSISRSRIAAYPSPLINDIIYDRPQLTQKIISSVMHQLEQTTQIAEENISFENLIELEERVFKDGETLIEEGDESKEVYRLLETQHGLKVTIKGKEVGTITKPGEYFGEMSAILKEPRSATVTSIGRSIVHVFSVENLPQILEAFPQLSTSIIDALAKRLYEANKKIVT